jgi:hypothetical protein
MEGRNIFNNLSIEYVFILRVTDAAELLPAGQSVRADCSRARVSARGNDFNPRGSSAASVPETRSVSGTFIFKRILHLVALYQIVGRETIFPKEISVKISDYAVFCLNYNDYTETV